MEKQLLEVKEAAGILNCKVSTLRTWMRRKQIPENLIFKIGSRVQIRAKMLEKFINGELEEKPAS